MGDYIVIHSVQAFEQHGDLIGVEAGKRAAKAFCRLKKGDRLIYYCTGDAVITGIFKAVSNPRQMDDDPQWKGSHWVVKIAPLVRPKGGSMISFNEVLKQGGSLQAFPARKIGPRFRGKTLLRISKRDLQAVAKYVRCYRPEATPVLFKGRSNDAGLGEPCDLQVMAYAPTSEQGVVALFVHHMRALGFRHLEFIRQGFPDACAIEESPGGTFSRKYIEFEFKASSFRQHEGSPTHREIRCDYVVCWTNDYLRCPVPVIELKSKLLPPGR